MDKLEKERTKKTKQVLVTQNITACKVGIYTQCAMARALKTSFVNNFNPGEAQNICDVLVVNQHALDVVPEFCMVGTNSQYKDGWMNPVTVCGVNRNEFTGTNFNQSEGITDDIYNIRTNYNMIVSQGNPFPLKDKECVYNKYITVIRDKNFQPIPPPSTYRFGVITVSPELNPELIDDTRMNSTSFLNTMSTIETVFQTAIFYGHNILLLTPLGQTNEEVPQEDIIKIYNSLIFKYQHKFKYIIVCVPEWDGTGLFDLYDKYIIQPQKICEEDEEVNFTMKIKNNNKTSNSRSKNTKLN
jgi:hypothetical protein